MSAPEKAPLLVVDASLQGVGLAIVDAHLPAGRRLLWHAVHPENHGAVAAVSTLVSAGLAATGLKVEDLRGLAVSHGPGSFTGIKVGLAFAYGFKAAFTSDLPVLGLSALTAAAAALRADGLGGTAALFLPATRTHGFFCGAGAEPADGWEPELLEAGQPGRARLERMPADTRLFVFGRWPLLSETLKDSGRSAVELAPSDVCRRAICGMAETAAAAWPAAFGMAIPEPRYLRLSTAEEALKIRESAK